MKLISFVLPPLENNNYLLIDEISKEAALVDCSNYSPRVMEALEKECAKLKYIILTHAHFDHILGVEKLSQETGAKVLLHEADKNLLGKLNMYTQMVGLPEVDIPNVDTFIQDGTIVKLGDNEIRVIHTLQL